MPMIATFHNTIFDIKCSNCKRTKDNIYFQQRGRVFKTCNECRDRSARRRMCPVFLASLNPPRTDTDTPIIRRIPDTDTSDDDDAGAVVHARLVRGIQYRPRNYRPPGATRHIPDSDTDDDVAAPRLYYVNSDGVISVPYSDTADMDAVLALSSSAAAAPSSSSAGDFNVKEPEPEPEPEGP